MKEYLHLIQDGESLTEEQAEQAMTMIMSGKADPIQISALLMGLSVRGETEAEVIGMLRAMRARMNTIALDDQAIDTCGTGGDGKNTFNISTAAALVCAALGVPIAKHGNRAASSKCGSADILEVLGVPIEQTSAQAKQYFKKHKFVFLFAPQYHPAMKHVVPIRKALGVRTIFNFLGPLANPAQVKRQVIGVSDPSKIDVLGKALIALGSERVAIVCSDDGLDELSPGAASTVVEFTVDGSQRYRIMPDHIYDINEIQGGDALYNLKLLKQLANGDASAALIQVVAMNAGLALHIAGKADSYEAGKTMAETLLRGHKLSDYLNTL